jgi:hypothetical protein
VNKKAKKAKKVGKKAAKAGTFTPSPASGITAPAEAAETLLPLDRDANLRKIDSHGYPVFAPDGVTPYPTGEAMARQMKQGAEVARQWAHRAKQDYHLEPPAQVDTEPEQSEATSGKDVPPAAPEGDGVDKLMIFARRLALTEGPAPLVNKNTFIESLIEQGPVIAAQLDKPQFDGIGLEPAADPVLQNGNGQAMIHYLDPVTGQEKVKGYTRVTTYIDGLDDKTVLTKWKMRTLLEGAAIEEDIEQPYEDKSIAKATRAVKRLDAALADIDQREKVDGELLELRRQELLKEHRDLLEGIADDLMELGGAHEKAIKGTNLHRLTELVDNGHPLPADTNASDRRDVEAYSAKMAELGLEVLWTERRVVLDDIQVSGTMDRAYLYKPKDGKRRIRVVGDLKTGSVSWGFGKIGQQLRIYAQRLGYDWTKPLEREPLRLSKAVGLLIHLPQGEGVCNVYEVDLELAGQGVDLSRQVREWRNTQKRLYDLKSPLTGPEEAKA